jgi:glycolate oxidase FAD binding subunit
MAALDCHGSLVVAEAPAAIARAVDVWGPTPALAVMRSLKARFDRQGTLNPGRFVGGI